MDFRLNEEQQAIIDNTRTFIENECYPHEAEVERAGELHKDYVKQLAKKAGVSPAAAKAKAGKLVKKKV